MITTRYECLGLMMDRILRVFVDLSRCRSAQRPPLWTPLKSILCVLTVMTAGLNLGDGWPTCFRPHLRIEMFIITEREKRRRGECGVKPSSVTGHNQGRRRWGRSGIFS